MTVQDFVSEQTKDSVDWSQIAPRWRWMARDSNGIVYVYEREPHPVGDYWSTRERGGDLIRIDDLLTSYHRGTVDWYQSLMQRKD